MAVIFVFLDGVGLGPLVETNPFWTVPAPRLQELLGGPLVQGRAVEGPGLLLRALDASLGVPGLPQSATGQTSLFTGLNAAQLLGYHLTAYPNAALRAVLNEHNILKRAVDGGYRATFANAYSTAYFQRVKRGKGRYSATTLSVLGAGLPFRMLSDLKEGQAVCWDITHKYLNTYSTPPVSLIEPEVAGRRLARLARDHDLVMYESFLPDLVGHRKDPALAIETLNTVDRFLAGLLAEVEPADTLVLSSDHGNLEDLSTKLHTTNPVPLLVLGPGVEAFREARAITDVAGGIMTVLDGTKGDPSCPVKASSRKAPTTIPSP